MKLVVILSMCLLLSACNYKATCWQNGEVIYETGWIKDRSKMPEYRGGDDNEVYWKINGFNKPIIASCDVRMK